MPVALAPAGTLPEKCFHALCTDMMSECGLKAVRRFSTVSLMISSTVNLLLRMLSIMGATWIHTAMLYLGGWV